MHAHLTLTPNPNLPPAVVIACHSQRDDVLFQHFLGIPRSVFVTMLRRFAPLYKPAPRNRRRPGRSLVIVPHQALAVLLMFYTSNADTKFLGQLCIDSVDIV
jgi:hypothetical protein